MSQSAGHPARKLVRFCMQLANKTITALRKPAVAVNRDSQSSWKRHFEPFCQVATASGAKWTCNGKGGWHLLEANGVPLETAVAELLEFFGIPLGPLVYSTEHEAGVFRRVLAFASFYRLGAALPMVDFECADRAENEDGKRNSVCRGQCKGAKPKCANRDQAGQDACGLSRSLKCATNDAADSIFIHGGSSVGVGLVGADHATRELSPRLYRGGDHA